MIGLFKNKKPQEKAPEKPSVKPPGKNQPSILMGAASYKDLIAPSFIKESEPGKENRTYYVEVGSTSEMARYFRSFYAAFTRKNTDAGMLDQLYMGDFGEADCDIALHIVPADQTRTTWELEQEIAKLETDFAEEHNSARRNRIKGQIQDLLRRHAMISNSSEKLFLTSVQVTASGTNMDKLKRFCNVLVKKFSPKGVFLRSADTRQLKALFGMTPLDNDAIKDTFRDMESSNIADLFPFGMGGLRHKGGIVLGVDPQGDIIFYDCWEPTIGNYNMVVFGRAGFGKSFIVKLKTERSSFIDIHTGIIEPGHEYENLMVGLECPYIRLSHNSGYRINIFDVEEEEDDRGNIYVNIESAIKAAQAVVFKMIRTLDNTVLSGRVKVRIQELIKKLYTDKEITEDPMSLYKDDFEGGTIKVNGRKKEMPTLSDFYFEMEKVPELKKASELLRSFTKQGAIESQAIFDCQSNVDVTNVQNFAISVEGLDEDIMRPIGLFVATKWVWEKFGKNWRIKKRIVIEEAQTFMDDDSIETAKWLEDAFRQSRRKNISMCAITQGFEVFLRIPQGMGILKNASTKILMRQEPVDIAAVKDKFSLSEGEAQFLLTSPKGWGIIKVNNDASIFYGDTTEEEYKMFTSDPNDLIMAGGVAN